MKPSIHKIYSHLNKRKDLLNSNLNYAEDCCDNKQVAAIEGAIQEIQYLETFLFAEENY